MTGPTAVGQSPKRELAWLCSEARLACHLHLDGESQKRQAVEGGRRLRQSPCLMGERFQELGSLGKVRYQPAALLGSELQLVTLSVVEGNCPLRHVPLQLLRHVLFCKLLPRPHCCTSLLFFPSHLAFPSLLIPRAAETAASLSLNAPPRPFFSSLPCILRQGTVGLVQSVAPRGDFRDLPSETACAWSASPSPHPLYQHITGHGTLATQPSSAMSPLQSLVLSVLFCPCLAGPVWPCCRPMAAPSSV